MGERHAREEAELNSGMAQVVARNITAIIQRRTQEERSKSREERIADGITRFTGSMPFVYIHIILFGGWIVVNLGWLPPIPAFDPTFVILAMFASVEAIFLSTFVLISQNRMAAIADKRADLDLQISLLAEHEVTRLIRLVTELSDLFGIESAKSEELEELKKDVRPEAVLEEMKQTEQRIQGKERKEE